MQLVDCEQILSGHEGSVSTLSILPDGRMVSGSDDSTVRIWNTVSGDCEQILSSHEEGIKEVIPRSDGLLLSSDWGDICLLWSQTKGGIRSESVSKEEYNRLRNGVVLSNGCVVGEVAAGYVVYQNCVQSKSFGRVFLDEAAQWVVKVGDVIAVFQENGRDHWFREV